MLHPVILLIFGLFSLGSLSSIEVVSEEPDFIYLRQDNGTTAVGYTFSLVKGTIMIKMNASDPPNTTYKPATYAVLPNLIMEYNASMPIETSHSVYSFLHFLNDTNPWSGGIKLRRPDDGLYQISAIWTNLAKKTLKFHTSMLVAEKAVKFGGLNLQPNEIHITFTITDYPYILQESTLAFDEILLTGAAVTNSTTPDTFVITSDGATSLYVNRTALVDGKRERVIFGKTRDETYWQRSLRNSTNSVSGLNVQDLLLGFENSRRARNVTFFQRLALNVAKVKAQDNSNTSESATSSAGCSSFSLPFILFMSSLGILLNYLWHLL